MNSENIPRRTSIFKRGLLKIFLVCTVFSIAQEVNAKSKKGEKQMPRHFSISVSCRGGSPCTLQEGKIFFEVKITNESKEDIGVPFDFIKKTGPIIKLTNPTNKNEQFLKTNLADRKLLDQFTLLRPKQSVSFSWVVYTSEVEAVDPLKKSVSAEVTILTKIQWRGKTTESTASTLFTIHQEPAG